MPDNPFPELRENANHAADFLSAMANGTRLLILRMLVHKEMTVNEIASTVGMSQSAVSQHLARLRDRQIVSPRRDGQSVHYMVASPHIELMLSTLSSFYLGANLGQSVPAGTGSQASDTSKG